MTGILIPSQKHKYQLHSNLSSSLLTWSTMSSFDFWFNFNCSSKSAFWYLAIGQICSKLDKQSSLSSSIKLNDRLNDRLWQHRDRYFINEEIKNNYLNVTTCLPVWTGGKSGSVSLFTSFLYMNWSEVKFKSSRNWSDKNPTISPAVKIKLEVTCFIFLVQRGNRALLKTLY